MALFRKIFYRKPPDGLLEISDRVFVFDCCFTTDALEDDDYRVYIGGIVGQLHECFPDASFMVFNFGKGEQQSQISEILSEFDTTVMDYPRQYENCPLLTMEMIHHYLRSSENWLSLGKMNVLLMHCDNGGLPILVFMLAALLIYRKQYTGEKKTLDMIYKQAPFQLLQLLSPMNPLPSQLRYLQYVSRRDMGLQWPPLDRALTLDCIMLRLIPNMDGEGGCRPIFRIYGQDPFMVADRTTKVLFSMPKNSRAVRSFKQANCELVKIDINCHVQGDVVLECITLDDDLEHEEMMFRVMFNTAFIRSNLLILNRDEIDILWNIKDRFPKDFTAEFIFSDMHSSSSLAGLDLTCVEGKEGLPVEAFATIQEMFNSVDWMGPKTEALNMLEPELQENLEILSFPSARNEDLENGLTESEKNELLESVLLRTAIEKKLKSGFIQRMKEDKLEITSSPSVRKDNFVTASSNGAKYVGLHEWSPARDEETQNSEEVENEIEKSVHEMPCERALVSPISSPGSNLTTEKTEKQEVKVSVQRPRESNIISPRISQNSQSNPTSYSNSLQGSPVALSRYHSAPSTLGITELLHDPVANAVTPQLSISASVPCLLKPALPNSSPMHMPSESLLAGQISFNSEITKACPPPTPPPPPSGAIPSIQSTQPLPSQQPSTPPSQPHLQVLPPSPPTPPPIRSTRDISSLHSLPSLSTQVCTPLSLQKSMLSPPVLLSMSQPTEPQLRPPPPPPPSPRSAGHLSMSDQGITPSSGYARILGKTGLNLDSASTSSSSSNLNSISIPPSPLSPPFPGTTLTSSHKHLPPAPSSPYPSLSLVSKKRGSPSFRNQPSISSTPPPFSGRTAPQSCQVTSLASPPPPFLGTATLPTLQNPPATPPPPPSSFSRTAAPLTHQNILLASMPPAPPSSETTNHPLLQKLSSAPIPPPPPPFSSLKTDGSLSQMKESSAPMPSPSPPLLSQTNISPSLRIPSPSPPPPPPPSSSSGSTVQNASSGFPPPPPPPPPPAASYPLSKTSSTTCQNSFLLPAKHSAAPASPHPPPPPPCSGPATVPPPPPPPPPCSGPTTVPLPPPPPCSGPTTVAPPPPPCSRPTTVRPPTPPLCSGPPTESSASAPLPPPPPPPNATQNGAMARSCQNVPPVPPPPLPGGSSSATNGKGIPAPPCTKGKFPMRSSTKLQAQARKTSLKPYHWLKLTRAIQGSIWAEAQKPEEASKAPELDMSELESLFSASAPNSSRGGASGKSRLTSGLKSDKVHLIELRRAYNCEIMLTKVKVPMSELTNSILAMDDSALDIDQVDNLIKFCPTKEEMELLKNYSGDKENLGKCEQFFSELMKIPRVESKLRVFSFKIQFCTQVSELRNSLNIINSASEEVRNSVKLKRIMQTILSLGNALNHGTARGAAVGFRLDSLLKLTETRARNNKLTLMHYLCKVLAEKLPEVLDFRKDLVNLEAATKIQLKYLAEEMQAFSKGLEKVMQELTASQNDGRVSENFCRMLKDFLGYAEGEVRSLASLYSGVGRNADALANYFGEDPARCPFEQVVSTLMNFVRMFQRAHEENCKQIELEKKKAQKESENQKAKLTSSSSRKVSENVNIETGTALQTK